MTGLLPANGSTCLQLARKKVGEKENIPVGGAGVMATPIEP